MSCPRWCHWPVRGRRERGTQIARVLGEGEGGAATSIIGLIRGFSRAVFHARVDTAASDARCGSVFFPNRQPATGEVRGSSTQSRDRQPQLCPPPPHAVFVVCTCMAACSPHGAPPSGASGRAARRHGACFRGGGGTAGFAKRRRLRLSGRRRHHAPYLSTLPDVGLEPRVWYRRARCAAGRWRGNRVEQSSIHA